MSVCNAWILSFHVDGFRCCLLHCVRHGQVSRKISNPDGLRGPHQVKVCKDNYVGFTKVKKIEFAYDMNLV